MNALANINGQILPLAEAKISALDRGFLFGDSVYEVLRVYRSRPWREMEHFQRFAQSLQAIRIAGVDVELVQKRMHETIAAGRFAEAIAYIQITRGAAAKRKHVFPAGVPPLQFMYIDAFEDPYIEMRRTGASVITHPDLRWQRCDIKSTNLLGNVLAMQAAVDADAIEAILHLPDGTLTEGSHTSFFGVKEGVLLTAPNSHAILPGITRSLVLQLAERARLPVREETLRIADLSQVSELFLTGTTSEVLPITRVDDRPIADGKPGPVTRRLQAVYAEAVAEFLAKP